MKEDLSILFERLQTEGSGVMREIYTLTSPHLFGIIKSIIFDEATAKRILKSVYSRVWTQRRILESRHKGDPLNYMRRLAHRSAMNFKFDQTSEVRSMASLSLAPEIDLSRAKALGVSEQDMRILKQAYLNGASVSEISDYEKLDIQQTKASLDNTIKRLRGDAS